MIRASDKGPGGHRSMEKTTLPRLVCVQTTLDDPQAAQSFAKGLVEARLAACVHITVIGSVYRWQGQVELAEEHLLTIKTLANKVEALEAHLRTHHPYDEPEFIVLPVEHASAGYGAWVADSVA